MHLKLEKDTLFEIHPGRRQKATPPEGLPTFGRHRLMADVSTWAPHSVFLPSQDYCHRVSRKMKLVEPEFTQNFVGKKAEILHVTSLPASLLPSYLCNNLKIFPCFSRDPVTPQ